MHSLVVKKPVRQIDRPVDLPHPLSVEPLSPAAHYGKWITVEVASGDIRITRTDHRQIPLQPIANEFAAQQNRRLEKEAWAELLECRGSRYQLDVRGDDELLVGPILEHRLGLFEIDDVDRDLPCNPARALQLSRYPLLELVGTRGSAAESDEKERREK